MKREVRLKARELRQNGWSVRDIAAYLNIAKSSVSIWVRDVKLTDDQISLLKEKQHRYAAQNKGARQNEVKFRELRQRYQYEGRTKATEGNPLHLTGCMLYWAEGAKQKNKIWFVNSDPEMLVLFIRFLRQQLCLSEAEITIRVYCHSQDPHIQRLAERYWLNLLQLSQENLRKTVYKVGSPNSKRVLEHGLCAIAVHNTQAVQHIFGAIQEYAGFEKPEWLG